MKTESLLAMLAGIGLAFVICAFLIAAIGVNPVHAYAIFFSSAFGSLHGLAETCTWATPLILTGLGLIFALKAKFWNIGAEGQLLIGASITAWLGISLNLPAIVFLPVLFIASIVAGAAWGILPAYLRAKMKVNEIITTLMMNFIATFIVSYLVENLLKESGATFPRTPLIQSAARLPLLIPGERLHVGFLIAIALSFVVYYIMEKTVFGYRIKAIGSNPSAAKYGGIKITKYIIMATLLSAGLAGLAGMGEVSGVHNRLVIGISPGYGYFAVIVALLGRLNPFGVVFAGIFFGGIIVGSTTMTTVAGIPGTFVFVIQAMILIFMLGTEPLMNILRGRSWRGK